MHLDFSSKRHVPKSYLEFIFWGAKTILNNHLNIILVLCCREERIRIRVMRACNRKTFSPLVESEAVRRGDYARLNTICEGSEAPGKDLKECMYGPRSGRPLRSCEEVRLLSRTMGSHSRVFK